MTNCRSEYRMKIAIIGGGAVGMLVSSYLSSLASVTLYVRRIEQKEQLDDNGLILKTKNKTKVSNVIVKILEDSKVTEDYIFLAVKQYDIPSILTPLKNKLSENQTIIFLQNGMGHLQFLEELKSNPIILGIVEHGTLKLNDYTVSHTGLGRIKLASWNAEDVNLLPLLQFSSEDFPILQETNYYEMLSKKLIVNAVINPLTSILKVENGQLLNNNYYKKVVDTLIEEISLILSLEQKDMTSHVYQVIHQTSSNHSSMLKDMENKKKTEIEAILGFLLEEARKKSVPSNQIRILYLLVKGLESGV